MALPGPVPEAQAEVALKFLRGEGLLPASNDQTWTDAATAALKQWQQSRGLDPTGMLDASTQTEMGKELQSFVSGLGSQPPADAGSSGAPATGVPSTTTGVAGEGGAQVSSLGPAGDPNADGKYTVPGGSEIWAGPDGYWYVVYKVPGTGTPIAWRIENNDDVAAIFGPGNPWKVDRTLNADEWKNAGVLVFGASRQLANTNKHPFDAFVANFDTEAHIRPWLRDPEILALTTRAVLEGRDVTEAELAGTNWWKTHTEGERQWIATAAKDPATAQQMVQDGHDRVRALMIKLGISNPPDKLVELIGNRLTAGTWTADYAQAQISKLADPYAPGNLDSTLAIWVKDLQNEGVTMNTLKDNTDKVDQLIRTWIGPAYADSVSKDQREVWASRLRNDPQAEEEIMNELKRKRLSLFPEYTDPNLSYEDIASTWRGVFTQMWGQAPNEKDPLFMQVVKLNDLQAAQELLRKEGLSRGNGTVVEQGLAAIGSALGNGVRGAI